jgi:hypothetical protein
MTETCSQTEPATAAATAKRKRLVSGTNDAPPSNPAYLRYFVTVTICPMGGQPMLAPRVASACRVGARQITVSRISHYNRGFHKIKALGRLA